MKTVMMLLLVAILMSGLSVQAIAAFVDGDLIRVVYSSDCEDESATNLGSVVTITSPITSNVTYSTNNFSLSSLCSSATPANSYVAYYAFVPFGNPLAPGTNPYGYAWTSGNAVSQNAKDGSINAFAAGYNNTTGLYFPLTSSPAQANVLQSNPYSYWTQMNSNGAGVGQMAGFITAGDSEDSLAELSSSSTACVDQYLHYYVPNIHNKTDSGLTVADIRTFADGHTELMPVGSTPCPTPTPTPKSSPTPTPTPTLTPTPTPISGSQDFNDVGTSNPAFAYIEATYKAGITTGCGNGDYCPSTPVTRSQMASFITRGLLTDNFSYPFKPYFIDVPSTYILFKYVQRFKLDSLTTASVYFYPDTNVPEKEMAAYLTRARQLRLGLNPENFPFTAEPWFTDVPSTDPYFKYVQYIKDHNITTATVTLNAGNNVARDEMAAYMARVFLKMQ